MGEHSVVYGHPALALPLKDIEVVCQIQAAETPLTLKAQDPLTTAIFSALNYLEIKNQPISYAIKSSVPEKRGMGSSAAVAIAAIRAVFDYFDQELSQETLEMLVHQAETIAHSKPSGLDAKTCLSDQAISFTRNIGFKEIEVNLGAYLFSCFCGLRISDIIKLQWKDVFVDRGQYRLSVSMQKTKEPIYLPLSPEALKWMPARGDKTPDDHVFDLPSPAMVNILIKPWAKAAGINKRFTFHTARHTFATMMLTLGADLYTTSKLLGHADVKMTQVYAKIINQKKDDAVNLVNGLFE